MLMVTSNKSKQLMSTRFIGEVRTEELQHALADITTELAGLLPGFRYLVDFSQFESMNLDDTPMVGRIMELLGRAGVGLVVRVIPDPSKDIGMNILTVFHYPHDLKVVTCQKMSEAAGALGL